MLTHEYDGRFEFASFRDFKPPPGAGYVATSPPWRRERTLEHTLDLVRFLAMESFIEDLDEVREFFDGTGWPMIELEPLPPISWELEGRRKLPWNKKRQGGRE